MVEHVIKLPNKRLRRALDRICRAVGDAGGRAYVVGGCVRDSVAGLPSSDLDIEVHGIDAQELEELLARHFAVDLVGKSFGVIKIKGLPIDVALPRRESKAGLGHRAFEILSDPWMTLEEAQSRRDFTINAMALDPLTGEIIDHYGGLADLEAGVLRHTSEKFAEDPLRVLRAMQFAARFELSVAPETIEVCRGIEPEGLPPERLYEEWKKLILKGRKPSIGLTFLRECGWVRYFPELAELIGCEQDPGWHPEGDVWTHTLHCMDAFAEERVGDDWEDLVVGVAVLCHDLGKPETTERGEDGRIRSHRHEKQGEGPTRAFIARLTNQKDLVDEVLPLVVAHLAPVHFYDGNAKSAAVRRLAQRVGRIDRLVRVARADHQGRPPTADDDFPAGRWLLEKARSLSVEKEAPRAIVMGRHLIEMGLEPGPRFGKLLSSCLEAQIEGEFDTLEGGLEHARRLAETDDERST